MKIPKGYPETVNHRKTTENAMTRTKRMERQIMMHKTLHRKQKIDQDKTPKQIGRDIMCSGRETVPTPPETPVVLHLLQN